MNLLLQPFSWLWHHKRISLAILILATLAFIFYPKPKPPVPAQTVTSATFTQTLSVSGNVTSQNSVNLTFPISGKLAWVDVKVGDTVTAGQTIATIDMQTALKNLKASLISYSLQRNTFDQTQSDNQNRTPDQALNDAMKRVLQDNQYNLDQAVNSVELQDLARQNAVLWTPIAGVVTRADSTEPGPDAVAGSTTFTIVDLTTLTFQAEVDQADIGRVSTGLPVHIVFDAYPSETLSQNVTQIDFVSHTTTNGGTAFYVDTKLPQNANYKYRVGMNASADIILSQTDNVLSVPLASIIDNQYVWVKKGNGFFKQKITTGLQNDTDAQVVSGLHPGDTIALDPTAASAQAVK